MINSGYRRSLRAKEFLGGVLTVLFIVMPQSALASKPKNIEESEMKLAPAYCRDTQGFGYGDAYSNTSPRAGHWVSLMGNSFWHMHHYCWARIAFNRSQKAGIPAQARKALWESARGDYLYVISNSPRDFVMLPEIYTRLGEVELLLGQPNKANEAFARAREQKPDYWPAYSHWAEFLMKHGKRPEALKGVITGLAYSPESKVLLELFRVLGGKPSDMPTPIRKAEPQATPNNDMETVENPPDGKKAEEQATTP